MITLSKTLFAAAKQVQFISDMRSHMLEKEVHCLFWS